MTTEVPNLTTRNATLSDLAELLKDQQAAKFDFVAPLSAVTSTNGIITAAGTSVFGEGSKFMPTAVADGHLANKLDIPVQYLRRLRAERPDLYDANINGFTQGGSTFPADDRKVLLRTFNGGDVDAIGVLRAVMSDRYNIIDHFDVLTAVLEGIQATGTNIEVVGCDLTETKMTVKIAAPEIFVNSPELLEGYKSPFGNGIIDHSNGRIRRYGNGQLPQWVQDKYGVNSDGVFAGLVISNSETGGGSFNIIPRLTVLKCTNGLMMTSDAMRQIHVGGKLAEGVIKWSEDTERKSLELITAQARDAVTSFLDPEYVKNVLDSISEKAATPIENPADAIEFVAKQLTYTQTQRDGILDHFIRGGQVTAGGVLQAVTSYAQTVANADEAYDLEASALKALDFAAGIK